MGITDWDAWMKEQHIYIPTVEEMEEARRQNLVKVNRVHREMEAARKQLEAFKKKVEAQRKEDEWLATISH